MSATTNAPRAARSRRLVVVVIAAVVIVAVVAAVAIAWASRPATGIDAALDDADFSSCLDREGRPEEQPSVEDAESWDEAAEVEFWAHPLALYCASTALSQERRERAFAVAFPALDGDGPGDIDDQLRPVADLAAWLQEHESTQSIAMLRMTGVLGSLWIADAEGGHSADAFANVAALSDLRARDALPGFDAWLAQRAPDDGDGDDIRLLQDYRSDVLEKAGEETEAAYHEYNALSRALYDVIR